MKTEKPLALGDPCPQCGSELKAALVPSDAQRKAAADRDNPSPVPPHYDTAAKDFVAEHGALYRCVGCKYESRFVPAAAKPALAKRPEDNPNA